MSGGVAAVNEKVSMGSDAAPSNSHASARSWSSALTKPLAPLIAAASLLSAENSLKGGIIVDGSDDAAYRARGEQFAGPITNQGGGAVAIKVSYDDPASPTGRSAIRCSGAIYNSKTVLSAAHPFLGRPGMRVEVSTGPNFRTNSGTIHQLEKLVVNPLFTDDSSRQHTFDLAVLVLADPIVGTLPATLSTNRPAADSHITLAGYGMTGSPNTGYITRLDGFARAGTSSVRSSILTGESPEFYFMSFFENPYNTTSLRGAEGDSGGPAFVLNNKNEVVSLTGIMVSSSILVELPGTTVLDITNPEVLAFIRQHAATLVSSLPSLSVNPYRGGIAVAWPYTPGVILQVAEAPQGPWEDSPVAVEIAEGTARAFFAQEQLKPAGFFRLRKGN